MSERKTYLGDGAYADFDGFAIELTTEDGIRATNRIVLEPEVLAALEAYVARLRAPASPPPAATAPCHLTVAEVAALRAEVARLTAERDAANKHVEVVRAQRDEHHRQVTAAEAEVARLTAELAARGAR